MIIVIILIVLFLIGIYYFWTVKQTRQRLAYHGSLLVSYLFQERAGQYSGDRSVKSGVIVIQTSSNDQKLKHATLKSVNLKHPDVNIQRHQSLLLPFRYNSLIQPEVSIRYKIIDRNITNLDLTGILIGISGKLHFEGGKTKPFSVVVPISGLYQRQVEK
jgi:hypothetical protein